MQRLAYSVRMSAEFLQITMALLNGEGTCACGRILRRLDAKFILINAAPAATVMMVAAYCQPCSIDINATLKRCHKTVYAGKTPTAPIEIIKKIQ